MVCFNRISYHRNIAILCTVSGEWLLLFIEQDFMPSQSTVWYRVCFPSRCARARAAFYAITLYCLVSGEFFKLCRSRSIKLKVIVWSTCVCRKLEIWRSTSRWPSHLQRTKRRSRGSGTRIDAWCLEAATGGQFSHFHSAFLLCVHYLRNYSLFLSWTAWTFATDSNQLIPESFGTILNCTVSLVL